MRLFNFSIIVLISLAFSCSSPDKKAEVQKRTKVEMTTDFGTIVLELYNETPKHRDNFIKIVKDGVLDSVLFHRVIENFMIQGGDINSKNASPTDTLGNGDLGYLVDAEFDSALFHKKGVLAAARSGNPARASSSTQFYITQGKILNDSLLDRAETRINGWLLENYVINLPENKELLDAFNKAVEDEDWLAYEEVMGKVKEIGEKTEFKKYRIPEHQREIYKTIGGTPHLDQNYTVFGEVVSGLEVVDSIAATQTGPFDRPIQDIRILKIRIVE